MKSVTLIACLCVVVVIATVVTRAVIRARNTRANLGCVSNLRNLDGATQQWAMENHKTTNVVPSWDAIRPYLRQTPVCPNGGTYTLGRFHEPPRCSIGGPNHTM
jgi:hypothetical protein